MALEFTKDELKVITKALNLLINWEDSTFNELCEAYTFSDNEKDEINELEGRICDHIAEHAEAKEEENG